jgi:hypothetical protein
MRGKAAKVVCKTQTARKTNQHLRRHRFVTGPSLMWGEMKTLAQLCRVKRLRKGEDF